MWSVTVAVAGAHGAVRVRTAKCTSVRKIGHEPFDGDWPLSGAYAEHIVLPARHRDRRGARRDARRGRRTGGMCDGDGDGDAGSRGDIAGRRVLICGAGMLGLTAAAACVEAGARVRVIDIEPTRLDLVDGSAARRMRGGPVDAAIDFSGSSAAIDRRPSRGSSTGGVLVLAGSVMPGRQCRVNPETVVRQWLTITGVHNYEPRHLAQAVEFLGETRDVYPWAGLVSEPVQLDDLASALEPAPAGKLRASVAP